MPTESHASTHTRVPSHEARPSGRVSLVHGVAAMLALVCVLAPGVTESAGGAARFEPVPDFQRGLRNYAADAWHIYSAPARMGWREAAILGGVVAVGGVLYANDEPIQQKIRAHDRHDLYGVVLQAGDLVEPLGFMGHTNAYYAGALVLGYGLQSVAPHPATDWVATVATELLQSHLTAGAFRQAGKIFVGRERPFESDDAYVFDDGTSFPSGHGSVITEFAVVTAHHVDQPIYTAAVYAAAAAVGLQRIDSGNHWASDTWAGMAYGAYVARSVVRRNEERRERDAKMARGGGAAHGKVLAAEAHDARVRVEWSPAADVAGAPGVWIRVRF